MRKPGKLRVEKVWAQLMSMMMSISPTMPTSMSATMSTSMSTTLSTSMSATMSNTFFSFFVSHYSGHLVYLHVGNHNVVSTFVRADDDRMEIRKYLQLRDVRG